MVKKLLKRIRFEVLRRYYGISVTGKGSYIGYNSIIKRNSVHLKKGSYIGNNCHLSVVRLEIGENSMLASSVSIVGGDHKYDQPGVPMISSGRGNRKGVRIGDDCWIGHGSILLDGVTIGDFSIIGAGSVVTKDVKPNSISVGNPARTIRQRFSKDELAEHKIKLKSLS